MGVGEDLLLEIAEVEGGLSKVTPGWMRNVAHVSTKLMYYCLLVILIPIHLLTLLSKYGPGFFERRLGGIMFMSR
jgi:hypothetical protein